MNSKRFWDHSGKPSVFVEVKEGKEVYRGPFKGAKADKHAELKAEIENLRKERDEAIADRDILRIDAQREAEHHDRMVGELERVYKERDELLQWKNEVITNLIRENEKLKLERDEARGAIKSTIAWLKERRNAPDFTTMGMVEERLLKALGAAK